MTNKVRILSKNHLFFYQYLGFWCKKSGYFTKPVKNFAIRIDNHSRYPEKIVHKGTNYSLKVREENFCNTTDNLMLIIKKLLENLQNGMY